jgi:diaminopimelate decarboxylase
LNSVSNPGNSSRPFHYKSGKLYCGAVSLATLAREHGTPLYVYSGDQILERAALFANALADVKHTICYAVKANSSIAILKLLAQTGAGFDIVSGGELERVLRASKSAARRVVFSGVGKTAEEMDFALRSRILLFNVESEGELELLEARAAKRKQRAKIALRVNPDVFAETHPYISTGLREHKFGIDITKAAAIYRRVAKSKWLEPAGISVHIGSQIRSAEPFGAAMTRVAGLVRQLQKAGIVLRYVDAGGGLGIEYNTDINAVATFDPAVRVQGYAKAVRKALDGLNVHLLLEPGRFLVAQAGTLVTRVLYVKKNGSKNFVITDAAMNDLIRPALYQAHHEIVPVAAPRKRRMVADVVGPVCESGDFFARDRELPALEPGDLVALLDAGAYGIGLGSNYNTRSRPAEILVRGRKATLIRRRETVSDQLAEEIYE